MFLLFSLQVEEVQMLQSELKKLSREVETIADLKMAQCNIILWNIRKFFSKLITGNYRGRYVEVVEDSSGETPIHKTTEQV